MGASIEKSYPELASSRPFATSNRILTYSLISSVAISASAGNLLVSSFLLAETREGRFIAYSLYPIPRSRELGALRVSEFASAELATIRNDVVQQEDRKSVV